ncbi:OLC1v1019499C1 [Oldenlandia corymbosa var. corymbosa]|uniref:OLC1v1019499C1 n=1 Tax=Oldenlandia corymbosa var. corymbosa TaxID=529605 RepID=A0AAV1EEB6_OLDCO|nr:OLC1v1019499C1 [Oldenlandia corymbosa var. corymbosa]
MGTTRISKLKCIQIRPSYDRILNSRLDGAYFYELSSLEFLAITTGRGWGNGVVVSWQDGRGIGESSVAFFRKACPQSSLPFVRQPWTGYEEPSPVPIHLST